MNYKPLYIFVEGDDDERFFDTVIVQKLQERFFPILFIQYAQNRSKIGGYIRSFATPSLRADYICACDLNHCTSAEEKITAFEEEFDNVNRDNVVVVIKEIESWYLAGLSTTDSKRFFKKNFERTDHVYKEKFNASRRWNKEEPRRSFMREILKHFDMKTAKLKNRSFRLFVEKYSCDK